MSHRFYEGEIFHKRFAPTVYQFTYDYFFIDIDVNDISSLATRLFSHNRFNIMSFFSRDHFGTSDNFLQNAHELIAALGWEKPAQLRFLTLPRMFGFVFNPISMLLLLDDENCLTCAIAEVHNYNGGRVLYPMVLQKDDNGGYSGISSKSMYVSPFMGYEGEYHFSIQYSLEHFGLAVQLHDNDTYLLIADFKGSAKPFSTATIRSLLCAHTFLSFFVVIRTLWQTLRLKLKGLQWNSPRAQDQIKKETV